MSETPFEQNNKFFDNAALIAGRAWTIHGDPVFGYDIREEADFGGFFDSVLSVVTAPARAAISVTKTVVNTASQVVSKVPVIGQPLSKLVQVPGLSAIDNVLKGQRIDKAVLGELQKQVQTIRAVAPLAASIVSIVPGVGTGVAAGIGAAAALINGQPIDQVLMSAVRSAIPGGAVAQAAFDVAKAGVQGQNVLTAALKSVPVALAGNFKILQQAAQGLKIDAGVVDRALKAVPAPVQKAFTVGIALGKAQQIQRQTNTAIKSPMQLIANAQAQAKKAVAKVTPLPKTAVSRLSPSQQKVLDASKKVPTVPAYVLKALPPKKPVVAAAPAYIQKAIAQVQKVTIPSIVDKMVALGKQWLAKNSAFNAGLNTLKTEDAKRGYYYGMGVMSTSGLNRVYLETFRKNLTTKDQVTGFDLALSARIGATTKVAPPALKSTQEQFAYYATRGAVASPTRVEQAKGLLSNPATAPAVKVAVVEAVEARKGLWQRFKEFFGFHGETDTFEYEDFI